MGFSLVYKGADGVVWMKSIPDFPYVAGFVPIVISWVSSPIITAAMSAFFYSCIRYFIFNSTNAVQRSIYFLPPVVFTTFFIESFFILSKGAGSKITWDVSQTAWVSICIATGASLLSATAIPFLKKKVLALEDATAATAAAATTPNAIVPAKDNSSVSTDAIAVKENSVPVTENAIVPVVTSTAITEYDPRVEYTFRYLQIFTSICTSFAHGANDVSNAVGPLAAIWYIYQNNTVASKIDVPIWILCLGGAGIVTGLATYGVKIMEVLGKDITYISPSRGFSAELATALTVSFASKYGLPISSTQCITGGVIGISICDHNFKDLNWKIIGKIFLSWVFTMIVTGGISAAIFSQGIYSPNV
jgi:sodium-dependent phosphate transporter